MATIEYHLYRVKFIRPDQRSLIEDNLTPEELFREALREKPSSEFRENFMWHLGNIEAFDQKSGSFAIGRTTKSTLEKFDKETGNFTEELLESSPYTYVVYDLRIGFVGIAKKTKLSPTTNGIALKLKKLLDSTDIVRINEVDVRVEPIPDPEDFIKKVLSAHAVKKFTAHFTGPNPIDADKLFQKPLSVYCQALHGEKGKTEVEGSSLDAENVVSISRATAATGNEATASIQEHAGDRPKKVFLKGNAVKKVYDDEEHDKQAALGDLREEYQRVRGNQ